MSYKKVTVDKETDALLLECIEDFKRHHKDFIKIPISRNKIIYEICKFYLKH